MDAQQENAADNSNARKAIRSVRIVIPVHQAADTLHASLRALCSAPICGHREVVVVDDGGNDDLEACVAGYSVELRVNDQPGSAARARNCGAAGFQGDILVFIDADVAVESVALQLLLDPIVEGRAEATVGNYSREVMGMSFAQRYKSLYLNRVYSRTNGYIRNEFWTALGAAKAEIFWRLGGFGASFDGGLGEDTDLGQRLTAAGNRILAVPAACGRHLHKLSWSDLFTNDLRKGSKTIHLFLKSGSPLSDFRHCQARDMVAVASACALAASPLLAISGFAPLSFCAAILGALLALYGCARFDLLSSFVSEGAWFLIRAALTMHLLDLTRAACVGRGLAHSLGEQLITSLHIPRRRVVHSPATHPAKVEHHL
jgi:hypothetical protein